MFLSFKKLEIYLHGIFTAGPCDCASDSESFVSVDFLSSGRKAGNTGYPFSADSKIRGGSWRRGV